MYTPCLYVLNMIDKITIEELDLLSRIPNYVCISAKQEWNFDMLLEKVGHPVRLFPLSPISFLARSHRSKGC